MAQVLVATNRITLLYTCHSMQHLWRGYVKIGSTIALVKQLLCRDGVTEVPWTDAIDYQAAINQQFTDADSSMSALLEVRSGLVWNPVAAHTIAAGAIGGTFAPASQITFVLRDTAFKKMRYVLMEGHQGYAGHSSNGYGIIAGGDGLVESLDGNDASPFAAYQWQKSRGDRYILGAGAVAGGTKDLNDKIKRARGLE